MKRYYNVTDNISFGNNDDELLPITQCVCGAKFKLWEFVISIYKDSPSYCPHCGRALVFELHIQILADKP